MNNQNDSDVEDFLAHYGVKGMKWGVVNEDKTVGETKPAKTIPDSGRKTKHADADRWQKAVKVKPVTEHEAASNLAAEQKKFDAKFDPDGTFEKNSKVVPFLKEHKVAIGLGVGFVGLMMYGAHQEKIVKALRPGQTVDLKTYNLAVAMSKSQTWSKGNFLTEEALTRSDFSLDVGHVFHRISTRAEDSFSQATYATVDLNDFNRYASVFRHEKGTMANAMHHVSWQSETKVNVASASSVLSALHAVVSEEVGSSAATDTYVSQIYQNMCGNSWSEPRAARLFSELKNRGYSAIIDEMDAGVIGESPIVLFDHLSMTLPKATPMNAGDLIKAEQSLVEIAYRKLRR